MPFGGVHGSGHISGVVAHSKGAVRDTGDLEALVALVLVQSPRQASAHTAPYLL